MTKQAFKKRLMHLQEAITRAIAYYTVWLKIQYRDPDDSPWSLEDQNRMLDRYRGFFTTAAIAMQEATLLQFAKLFDEDSRTSSLPVLVAEARRAPALVPQSTPLGIRNLQKQMNANATRRSLKQLRNKRLAHIDADPGQLPPIPKKELDSLVETIESIYNTVSSGHDGNVYDWHQIRLRGKRDTESVITAVMSGESVT